MAKFSVGKNTLQYDPAIAFQAERDERTSFEMSLGEFFDPAVDIHSAFYAAMEYDKHAAHLVAGTSFLDLNSMILTTECNNSYESMNVEDMQRLRKLMWEVYIPHMKESLASRMSSSDDDMHSFQAQMYVVHLSVRVAQALQLVFELNQKKSFSAVAKTAYEVALQDVLYHPSLKGHIKSDKYKELINFLRRHPTYSTAFNTYVGCKLLRRQLVRGGGAGTNRKSNDAETLHNESANRLWSVLDENRSILTDFKNAPETYTMEWHRLYYKEVAQTLFDKLTTHGVDEANAGKSTMTPDDRDTTRKNLFATQDHLNINMNLRTNVDIMSAIQESRETVAEGTTKRSCPDTSHSNHNTEPIHK
jgi:hypothetical protein